MRRLDLKRAVQRHRPSVILVGILLMAGLFPAGPLGMRARLASFFSPLGMLRGGDDLSLADVPPEARPVVLRMREEIDALRASNRVLLRERRSLEELRGMESDDGRRKPEVVAASVLGWDRRWPARRSVLVGRGSRHGIRRGQPVVAGRSLVGFVMETGTAAARVRMLDDPGGSGSQPDVRVGVQVVPPEGDDRAVVEGALVGAGRGALKLTLIPGGAVQAGDLVITSSADPLVPSGLLIGRVVTVRELRDRGLAEADVRPSADMAGRSTLYVLRMPGIEEDLGTGAGR